jgi:WD40 repeat protein
MLELTSLCRQGESNALLSSTEKHSGPVQALDFNPNQPNLLASGGPNSEVSVLLLQLLFCFLSYSRLLMLTFRLSTPF